MDLLNLNVIQMFKTYLFAAVAAITLSSCGGNKVTVNDETITLEDGIYAKLETTMGDILIDFHEDLAPMTAANFIALSEGNHTEVDEKYAGLPYYNGTLFHRVIKNFMIQGGDPDGTGSGGPGYAFPQEITEELRHDKAGVVSMANAGQERMVLNFSLHTTQHRILMAGTIFSHRS